ncbi:UDP-4-amino-4,6-dideoxy-N-acetyl-beta-L-altrosamine transaminase [Keratinibaculum paraultunense]|uniref:UDP-4-amino-4, 6-dideoxy-N-acetyl-beta-L-altrosamine transaminase n=1 Tax=Keratinibaculum paraultunense TaxID=1278232 RepID=A0A4R3KU06_9FIRM|nr:UDP-4-amino-4,6-dideoxy-N-acetyl-beta-L-altrosamine transaminase [Keratinibaculum paraultunense]QQY79132.1 UDP-4-amino-4,6-dideoxy-N-acetyl-beta-L-altrosamine transaminase [Keratinibaculum paraultunense]TCS88517.1 UDP-4-amino-4,6-dideoxy-N-acetyl-beta-L-altrosamine transaminase [Keratinibaculum paraultunense]
MTKLAINGGTPVRDTYLPYGQQWIEDDDIEEVVKALKSDYLTTGPKIKEFEEKFGKYVGVKYAVAISNGTAALHGASFAAGIKEGDEVITTPITFAASANCILYQGGKPVFADIDSSTYNIDPKDIEEKISSKTKAIVPVDFTGQPVNIDEINAIAKKYNLIVIEDGAHSLGAEYKGKRIGSLVDMTTFSFHPVKHITTGEGGMITTNNKELYEKLKLFRTHGITRDKEILYNKNESSWYYEQLELGYNYRITDIQCALGISQLNKIDKFLRRRREIAEKYNEYLKDIDGIVLPYQEEYIKSSWHLYVIQLELEKFKVGRREIFEALQAENIGVNVHYIPVYYHPYYQKLGYKKGLCPNAEKLYERIITIPLYPKMTDKDVKDVVEALDKVLKYYKR